MLEHLGSVLRSLPADRLELFEAFCSKLWQAGRPPGAEVWHALAAVAAEALAAVSLYGPGAWTNESAR